MSRFPRAPFWKPRSLFAGFQKEPLIFLYRSIDIFYEKFQVIFDARINLANPIISI